MLRTLLALAALLLATPAFAAPGRLISATPMAAPTPRSNAWRVVYESRDADGRPNQVAGVVITPRGPAPEGGWPVVAWAHGSWGVEPKCTLPGKPAFYNQTPFFGTLLQRGYAVVATDYPGFSTGGMHPYLAGDATGHAVIDSVRAARRIQGANTGRDFAVWGESQGGHAALWTAQLARAYAPGLNLVAVAAAAPPTDLASNLGGKTDPTIRAFLTAYTGASWEKYYGADLGTVTGPVGRDLIRRISKNCIELAGFKFSTQLGILRLRGILKNTDLAATEPWRGLLARNSVARVPLGMPLLVMQSSKDVVVAPDVTRAYVRDMCRQGQRIRFLQVSATEHQNSAKDTAAQTIDWIADRFAGRPEPNDCGRV